VTRARFDLTRTQVLAFRRSAQALDKRLPAGPKSLRRAAWAGLQDSMPRAAVLSIHARVEGTQPSTWEDPSLVQLWGLRYSVYVVAARDRALFTLGRLLGDDRGRRRAEDLATRLEALLKGRKATDREAADRLGGIGSGIRYAAPSGRVLIRWEGARAPIVWSVPAPNTNPREAALELARRYLHVFGPATPDAFAGWAGIGSAAGRAAFNELGPSLAAASTPIGEGWVLASDEAAFRAEAGPAAEARLLPSGDTYFLLQGADRDLLVPDARRRGELWTTRVWPGAVLVAGEIVGTWRRAGPTVTVQTWRRLTEQERDAIAAEAASMPLPGIQGQIRVRWDG
jgi:hypothetical protein